MIQTSCNTFRHHLKQTGKIHTKTLGQKFHFNNRQINNYSLESYTSNNNGRQSSHASIDSGCTSPDNNAHTTIFSVDAYNSKNSHFIHNIIQQWFSNNKKCSTKNPLQVKRTPTRKNRAAEERENMLWKSNNLRLYIWSLSFYNK